MRREGLEVTKKKMKGGRKEAEKESAVFREQEEEGASVFTCVSCSGFSHTQIF